MQRVVRSSLVGLLTLAGLTACGDKVTVPPTQTTPPDQVVHSVTVTPSSVSLKVGDKVTLAASVDAGAGVTNRGVTWSTSSATVATVDANGTVTAVAGGTATIIAKSAADPTVSGAAVVQVAAVVNASLTVGQINQTVCVVGGACTSIPANLSNVAGQLDVTLNVDPGTQTVS
ncbi:MAG TPA: Ig-like domain-containing protein, partial [Gemmatimonadaceae bacterium]|nr:Ig-like domain-containing protein [Gemmatimonadaceae bacterium]